MMGIQYQIILRAGDGTEFGPFPIRDHYFERNWTKIGVEVRREIMEHDRTYEEPRRGRKRNRGHF